MYEENLKLLRCVYCKARLKVDERFAQSQILSCKCQKYPLISGILYLKRNKIKERAISYILSGNDNKGLLALIDLRRRLSYPVSFLLLPSIANRLTKFLFGKHLFQILGFKRIIQILTIFSYSKPWSKYLVGRHRMPTFYISLALTGLIKENDSVLDFGCGVGHLLPYLSRRAGRGKVFGLDKSFFSLFLARIFFAQNQTLLICQDFESGLPFKDGTLDKLIAVDSFHNVVGKSLFIEESQRALKGYLSIIHTLNTKRHIQENITGMLFSDIRKLLRSKGFKNIYLYSNLFLWNIIRNKKYLNIQESDSVENLKNCVSYSLIASKKSMVSSFQLSAWHKPLIEKNGVNYSLDGDLLENWNLTELLNHEEFIFLSPHFDDAVLSCGYLLDTLKRIGKKILIITFFTKATDIPYTKQAKVFLEKSGFSKAKELFQARKKEDLAAMKNLSASYMHFDLVDATFRKNALGRYPLIRPLMNFVPALNHVYTSEEEQFSGEVSWQDHKFSERIVKELKSRINKNLNKKTIFLSPLGVGGHVDHIIVRNAAESFAKKVVFWEDFPYNLAEHKVNDFFSENDEYKFYCDLEGDLNKKSKLIKFYRSQFKGLFPDGRVPKHTEKYFIRDDSEF